MVGRIIGVSGLCGAGKSTAVNFLAAKTRGEVVYFGATVLRVVQERGLPNSSASEQTVRIQLRDHHGPAYLAVLETERIRTILASGRNVFIDAVYVGDEFDYLSGLSSDLSLIGIETSFSTRLARLAMRAVRPMTEPQVRARDALELAKLKIGNVAAKANIKIENEGSMEEFEASLVSALQADFV
jgi:dephospho-CoA kinase